jgi:hypothetical protein
MEGRTVAKTESANLANPVRCSSCSELPAPAIARIVVLFTAGTSLVSTIDGPRKKY